MLKSTLEMWPGRGYFIIYSYNTLEDGQGAMPSGVQSIRLCISVGCVSLEWFEEVCLQTEQLREYGGKCV